MSFRRRSRRLALGLVAALALLTALLPGLAACASMPQKQPLAVDVVTPGPGQRVVVDQAFVLADVSGSLGSSGHFPAGKALIQAFTAVANANPAEKADLLSASISVAMNTTAFGLMVAIPLLIVHAVLTSKTGEIVDSLEMATVKALNVFSRRAKRMADRSAPVVDDVEPDAAVEAPAPA